jgi:putative type II site-specific deoxyribonuclease
MKHPVDTSQWGEFVVGELFDVQLSDGDNKPKKLPKGTIPLVSAGNTNNGIVGSFESNTIIFPAHSITVDMFGQAFYQPKEFQAVSHGRVNVLVPSFENNENIGQFIVTILNAQCQKYSFTEMLTSKKIKGETIPLPLKPSADPENYTQDDIDWDYMDMVMSRVTEKAKERLASLPTPRSRSKTLVDTSSWGEFVVGGLFDNVTRGTRLKKSDRKVGSTH